MPNFLTKLWVPTYKKEIQGVAPTYICFPSKEVATGDSDEKKTDVQPTVVEIQGYVTKAKARRMDRWLDAVVVMSGSEYVFFTILSGLFAWAFLGIQYHDQLQWPALISDIQAIISYVFDSFLMRQQTNGYEDLIRGAAELRSRAMTHARTLRKLAGRLEKDELEHLVRLNESEGILSTEFSLELPKENRFGRFATNFAHILGHLAFVVFYWICIFVWLGFGPSNGWSNMWQLDINSATSALMVLVFSFLANIRERHSAYLKRCLDALFRVDAALEIRLRTLTEDTEKNETVVIPPIKANTTQKIIFYYADVIGTLIGIAILFVVLVIWIGLGPVMQFSDNWWLFIGTYAGLVGMNDGFVLRNVQSKLREYEDEQFNQIGQEDAAIFGIVHMNIPDKRQEAKFSLTRHVSVIMAKICAHELMVVAGVLCLLGLLTVSSVMKWNTTGQLISNLAPSVIESFFMIILITGHNFADAAKREDMQNLYERRLRLLSLVNRIEASQAALEPETVFAEK